MPLRIEQQWAVIEDADCLCINTSKIDLAVARESADEIKPAVEKAFKKYIRKAGPNSFQCRKCDKPFHSNVGDESPVEKVKPATPAAPPTVPSSELTPDSCAVSPEILKLAKVAARSNDFRPTVSPHSYQTMGDWIRSVFRYDLDEKELATCHKIILRGGQCTREQISATLCRNIHRDWNIEALEETFRGLATTGDHTRQGEQYRDLAKLLTAQQVRDLIEKETGLHYERGSIRKLATRGKLLKHGNGRACYPLFSVLAYIESLPQSRLSRLSRYPEESQQ